MSITLRVLFATLFVLPLVPTVGCNAIGGPGSRERADANAGIDDGRLLTLEARMIGLTEELDRFARRLAALERSLDGSAPVREPAATPPETPEETATVPDEPIVAEAEPETPAPDPDPIENWPIPEQSEPPTAILIDGRGIPAGTLPGTSQIRWRIVDPEAVTIFSNADVDPQVLRTRPLFWTAKASTPLGPGMIPILGAKPLTAVAVNGALLTEEDPVEAVIYVDAKTATKLRGLPALGDLVRSGSLAILLRPDGE